MITYNQIQEYCNDLGYVDGTKFAKKGIQYVKIQRWSDKQGYHKTGEKNTVCKMKLPVVDSAAYTAYMKIRHAFAHKDLTPDQAIEQFATIGVKAWKTVKGITNIPPSRYDYDITMEQLKEYVEHGTKWEAVRENRKLERIFDVL